MSAFLTALVLAQEKSTAEEGRDIVISMLVVGLIFLSVIALGQFSRWLMHRRGRGH
jgi:heme/copper-type cytochrome/quinol oxidase subunit 2